MVRVIRVGHQVIRRIVACTIIVSGIGHERKDHPGWRRVVETDDGILNHAVEVVCQIQSEAFARRKRSRQPVVLVVADILQRRPIVPQPSASGVDNAQPFSPMKALALLSTLQSADIVLPTTDGREIRLRRITEPTAEQKSLLHGLGLSLPERLKSTAKCSADFATA